jgi:hypothetical protein
VKKTARQTELDVLWHSKGFPLGLSVFFVSSACFLVRVTVVSESSGNDLYASVNARVASLLFILEG